MIKVLASFILIFFAAVSCDQEFEQNRGEEPDPPILHFSENGSPPDATKKENSAIHERPYMVSLRMKSHWYNLLSRYCEGAVLNDQWIITSGRCCVMSCGTPRRPDKVWVRAGSSNMDAGGVEHEVDRLVIQGGYHINSIDNNTCLLKMKVDFKFGPHLQALKLSRNDDYVDGVYGKVSGWSKRDGSSANPLTTTTLALINNARCQQMFTAADRSRSASAITSNHICAFADRQNICHGVAGGPLVVYGKLAGVVTHGIGCNNNPAVYTRISEIVAWIQHHIGDDGSMDVPAER